MEPKRIFLAIFVLSILSFFLLLLTIRETYLYEAPVHIGLFSAAMFFLWKKDLRTTLRSLGIPGNLKKNILYTVGGFFAIIFSLYIVGYLLLYFDVNDQTAVVEIVQGLPLYVLVLAVLFAPFSEELFFRAFLVPRIGVLGSSVVFALLHLSYSSISELSGAFVIGLILALIYKYSKSVIPPIMIHMAFNFIAVGVMLGYS